MSRKKVVTKKCDSWKCKICSKIVTDNNGGYCCDKCDFWLHWWCVGESKEDYTKFCKLNKKSKGSLPWNCPLCLFEMQKIKKSDSQQQQSNSQQILLSSSHKQSCSRQQLGRPLQIENNSQNRVNEETLENNEYQNIVQINNDQDNEIFNSRGSSPEQWPQSKIHIQKENRKRKNNQRERRRKQDEKQRKQQQSQQSRDNRRQHHRRRLAVNSDRETVSPHSEDTDYSNFFDSDDEGVIIRQNRRRYRGGADRINTYCPDNGYLPQSDDWTTSRGLGFENDEKFMTNRMWKSFRRIEN